MKNVLLIVFFAFLFPQEKPIKIIDTNLIILDGYCYEVLSFLKEKTNNDSIVVSYFRENYIPTRPIPKDLKNKKPSEFIKYYFLERNKQIRCIHKKKYYENVLLKEK
ncbi:hypothetical protein [Marinifilum sp. D737]|uniref:hypothetical protein n=1 Tax=Marinifilum sp. D737 TaxID=2969628 RepID=UPI0022756928|nr:hypothetical protein [Marinifilum sp. D737]MCY1634167.1 hypothetical protein [Marinifilum sp. D737]